MQYCIMHHVNFCNVLSFKQLHVFLVFLDISSESACSDMNQQLVLVLATYGYPIDWWLN